MKKRASKDGSRSEHKRANRNPKSSMFVVQFSETNVSLNFRPDPSDEFYSYGDAYHRAARVLFKRQFRRGTRHDFDVLPVAFLYRHAAELFLKAIVRRGNRMLALDGKPPIAVHDTHQLALLLDDVRPIFRMMGWSWDTKKRGLRNFANFRRRIKDLESDDVLGTDDKSGDMWRYPIRKRDGSAHFPKGFGFDVRVFVSRFDLLIRMLAGAAIGLDMEYDEQIQQRGEAAEEEARYRAEQEAYDYEPPDMDEYYEPPSHDGDE